MRTWYWIPACCAVLASTAFASRTLNLPQTTADTKAKIAAGGQANIVLLGDSLSFDDTFSFRPYFTQRMQSLYGDAGPGYLGAAVSTTGYGPDWRSGILGPADPAPQHALDGLWVTAPASAALPSGATMTSFYDKIEIQYLAQPGGGNVDLVLSATGQFIARLDTNAASPVVRTFTYDFPPNIPTRICLQPDGSGPVTLLGMNRINDTPGVRVHRASNGGWGVDHYLRRDSSFDQQLKELDTDLVMVAIGVNDGLNTREQYISKLNLLVDRIETAVPDSEILMIAPYDYNRSHTTTIVGAIEDVAAARGLGLINLYEIAGNYEFFQSQGYLADGLHFTQAGGDYVGNILFNAFRTDSAPEPASLLAVAAGGFLLVLRPTRSNRSGPTTRRR